MSRNRFWPPTAMDGLKVALASAALLIVLGCGEQPYDSRFNSQVSDPAYPADGPVILFDEGHRNTHTTTSGYKPLADLLRNDGYSVRVVHQALSPGDLQGVAVLVLALARGANDTNDEPAYSEAERALVDRWVRAGGSLLLITDHWPYGAAVSSLAQRFGIEMGAGMAQDLTHHDPERGDSHLIFSVENGLLRDHPIVRGRNSAEHVRRVLTFTGQTIRGPGGAVSFLALSDEATERPPGPPRVERAGGDVRVHMEYGEPTAAAGRAQASRSRLTPGGRSFWPKQACCEHSAQRRAFPSA
ncbi:MAG: hypothetical protein IPK72_20235 [Candidatus Eisenbacteria bacterium]|nr:hypothetical protein [Candidatus Eisenbacteria bacterium]